MIYLLLFWEFLKIGLFTIGGGLAAIPLLEELTTRYDWFTASELTEMIAIAESTPGPIGINAATYAGFRAAGVLGGVVATFSFALPSLVIMSIAALLLGKYHEKPLVKSVFSAIRPVVLALICSAYLGVLLSVFFGPVLVWNQWDTWVPAISAVDWRAAVLFALTIFGVLKFDKHPILYIGIGAVLGILLKLE